MGSQKQSHRVRRMQKAQSQEASDMLEAIYKKQRDINNLQNQNMRLKKRLRHYESRPVWWKFAERKKWRANHEND